MLLRCLAFLGRNGAGFLASGLFVGLALPPVAHAIKPLFSPLIFLMTTAIMLSIDWPRVRLHARRPGRVAVIVLWVLILSPVLIALAVRALDLPQGLAQGLVLWAAAPPLMSLPSIALLMGLDAALSLLVMIAGTFLVPLTLPPLLLGLIGLKLAIGILPLMARLAFFIVGAAAVSALIRHFARPERLTRYRTEINGANVILLVMFAIAIMDGMWARIAAEPVTVLVYSASALGISLLLQGVSFLLFSLLDAPNALTIGLIGGNKNTAIVWASVGAAASPDLLLFFTCTQLPVYLLPAALAPFYRRFSASAAAASRAD
ncbi:MAG TPA: hypothetical protein VMC10_03335 [Stellaceae bacterium]|nr:hypothetical protein [Stellaceae bacterium]